ncbi:MAG: choice-of-anchor D domain-containing protein [Candidatus Velamenicoccus archaeovorus]
MSDGRLTVVIAGRVYPSVDGVRLFLEGSGYEVVALVSSFAQLEDALAADHPDAAIVGDELVGDRTVAALRRISPDTRVIVVGPASGVPAGPPDGPDAYVPRGEPLAAFTTSLAALLVGVRQVPSPPLPGPATAARRRGAERVRALQLVAAVAVAFGLGGLALLYSGGTRPVGGTLALPSIPPVASSSSPSPGTSPAAAALQQARSSLVQLVQAIQSRRFGVAVSEAETLIAERHRAEQGGASVDVLDTEVLSALQPVVGMLPVDLLPTFQRILGGLMPPVAAQVQITGSGAFGQVQVGSSSDARSVVIGNAGGEDLELTGVALAGAAAAEFSVSTDCAGALRPGGSCTVQVTFAPTTPGDKLATLVVEGPDAGGASLPLSGTGVVAPPPDADAPVIVCDQPAPGWFGGDVAVTCTAQDPGSGLEAAADASFSLTTTVPPGTEDANAFTGARTVCDREGNCAQAGPIGGIRVDRRAPEVSCERPDRAWRSANASVACRSRDRGSGLAAASDATFALGTSVGPDAEVVDAATGSRRVCDAVGNCTTAGPFGGFKIDRRAPEVTCERPDDAWHGTDVRVDCSATDGGSGIEPRGDASFGLSTNVPAGTTDANAATGTARVCDAVGNCTTAGPIRGFKVDKEAPRIALTGLSNGATYLLNESVSVGASAGCTDQGSGVDTCTVPDRVDTGSVGTFSLTVTASDEVGNTASLSVSYAVTYGVELSGGKKNKIELRLVDARGANVSSSSVEVTAMDLDGEPLGRRFTYDRHDQEYSLTIPGNVHEGSHVLHVRASGDPVTHTVTFIEE